ncbi:MAG: twin-arginine translocation signal domain-containing protein [Kiritimatiellae bacterium]|nr:twin-arginine translocation signal domain-containing protein [Kiritimatiellia bacterium]
MKHEEDSDMTSRRDFVKGAAMTAGAAALGGCKSVFGKTSFYGPTIRDRLWMWGHHSEMCHHSVKKGDKWPGKTVEQAEGCRMMGIPNDCVIRWGNKPAHPWGNYFEQFKTLKRISFGITDGGNGTVWDKLDWAINEIKPQCPNLTGGFLDDFFAVKSLTQTEGTVQKIADRLHENNLRLSIVVYSDQDGIKPQFKPYLDICDETSFWCWHSKNLTQHADAVRRMRDFIGPDKSLLMGVYMWDYTLGQPVPQDRMENQLAFARELLREKVATGLIFHPSYSAALDVPAVNLAKKWIAAYGENRWGV